MKYLIKKDLKLRYNYFKKEKKIVINKFLIKILLMNKFKKIKKKFILNSLYKTFFFKKNILSSKNSRTKIVNRCFITNRSRGVKKNGISRFILRNLMQFGIFPGYKKSVW